MTPSRHSLRQLDEVFLLDAIMTPRKQILTTNVTRSISTVLAEARRRHFDIVLCEENEKVTGLIHVATGENEALGPRWLVSRDTPISRLPELFLANDTPALLVLYRQDVVGLVAPADLNKLPLRAHIYHVIGALEMALARFVMQQVDSSTTHLLQLLRVPRRRCLEEQLARTEEGNADVDAVHLLYFTDLIDCLGRHSGCRDALGYTSRSQVQKELGGLNQLRSQTMHTVRPLVQKVPDDLRALHSRLARAQALLEKLEV